MKKVLLIFADSSVKKGLADAGELKRLLQEAEDSLGNDVQVFTTYARSLSYFVSNSRSHIYDHRNRMPLEDYDFVYFRKAGSVLQQMLACAIYLKQHGVPFYDTEIARTTSRNKLSQMFKLQQFGVSIPTTLYCRHKARMVRLCKTKYAEELPLPLIVKATGGTRGDANYLIHSYDELEKLVRTERRHFLIQKFVQNEGDYRVLVANSEVGGVIQRVSSGENHLNNTSKGGSAAWLSSDVLTRGAAQDAVLSAVVLGRDFAGVDIILDANTDKHYVLEVNRAPQIEHSSYPDKKARLLAEAVDFTIQKHVPQLDTMSSLGKKKRVIGRFENVVLPGGFETTAKIDTGADTTAIHCDSVAEVRRDDKTILQFSFDGVNVHEADSYSKMKVKSSNGQTSERFMLKLDIVINHKVYPTMVTLSHRYEMKYHVLLGRRFLRDHALVVDVARRFVVTRSRSS